MNSHKKVQRTYALAHGMIQYGAHDSAVVSERMALVDLLREHLLTTLQLRQHVLNLELRLRNVSFVDVRQLFHRIGEATEQCSAFLDERIHDLGAPPQRQALSLLGMSSHADETSFATCLHHISENTCTLMGFAPQTKVFMDRAVINGDYNSLHLMTDCVYQISQLVALIQIHLPAEPVGTSSRTPVQHAI